MAERARTERIFAAVDADVKERLAEVAGRYQVDLPTLIRWWAGEAVSGVWVPAHLRVRREGEK